MCSGSSTCRPRSSAFLSFECGNGHPPGREFAPPLPDRVMGFLSGERWKRSPVCAGLPGSWWRDPGIRGADGPLSRPFRHFPVRGPSHRRFTRPFSRRSRRPDLPCRSPRMLSRHPFRHMGSRPGCPERSPPGRSVAPAMPASGSGNPPPRRGISARADVFGVGALSALTPDSFRSRFQGVAPSPSSGVFTRFRAVAFVAAFRPESVRRRHVEDVDAVQSRVHQSRALPRR